MHNQPGPPPKRSKVTRRDLALAVPAHMRDLPADLIQEEMDRRRRMLERFDWMNPLFRRRLKYYVWGSILFLPLFSWFFTPVGFTRLWLQIPLAAGFGVGLAASRADGPTSMLFCLGFGLFHFFVVGGNKMSFGSPGLFLMLASTCLLWMVLGWALGASEDLKRSDGT